MSGSRDWLQVVNNLPRLTNLDLHNSELQDPSEFSFANTSKGLAYLDLSSNYHLTNSTFKWLFNYTQTMVHLDMSYCQIELASFPQGFADMNPLSYLDLSDNLIAGSVPDIFENLTSLTYLGLRQNRFSGFIPESFGKLTSLQHLDLQANMLQGEIPKSIWEICTLKYDNNLSGRLRFAGSSSRCDNFSLEYLDLARNSITEDLPDLTLYPSLAVIQLSLNRLTGDVSESIGKFSKLEIHNLTQNSIEAAMSEAHFPKLFKLSDLDLSSNKHIVLNFASDWIPPFQLEHINLVSCKLGPRFPRWLETQKKYVDLNMSHYGISDSIPNWLWNFSARFTRLDLSNNELKGAIPDRNQNLYRQYIKIDLSLNNLEGKVPLFLLYMVSLNLYQNRFSGISSVHNLSRFESGLFLLNLSRNNLSSQMLSLNVLDFSKNHFSGEIPSSLSQLGFLRILDLSSNNFSGKIPTGSVLQKLEASAYQGNPELCGAPLPRKCPGEEDREPTNSEAIEDSHQDQGIITNGFYISAAIGYFIGFFRAFLKS